MDKKHKKILRQKVFAVVASCGHVVPQGFFSTLSNAKKCASWWSSGHSEYVYSIVELVEKEVLNG